MQRIDVAYASDPSFDTMLSDILDAEAKLAGAPFDEGEISLKAYGDDGTLLGGMIVEPQRGWLYVKSFALKQSGRGHGFGQSLLARAEALATELSLVGVYLDTFDFEAPDFYAKCGYTELAHLPKFESTKQKYWFYKLCGKDTKTDDE